MSTWHTDKHMDPHGYVDGTKEENRRLCNLLDEARDWIKDRICVLNDACILSHPMILPTAKCTCGRRDLMKRINAMLGEKK